MAKQQVVITGATGRLGQVVLQQLMPEYAFAAVVRKSPDARLAQQVSQIAARLEDVCALEAAMVGAEQGIMILPDHPRAEAMAASIVEAAERIGLKRIIKISAHLASQDPPLSFGIEHAAADARVQASAIESVIFRPALFMQSLSLFLGDMQKGRMLVPVPKGKVALVDAYDIAAAVKAALGGRVEPGTYMLTGPQALSFAEITGHLSEWSGKPIKHIAPPRWLAGVAMRFDKSLDRFNRERLLSFLKALEAGLEAPIFPDLQTIIGRPGRTLSALLAAMPAYDGSVPNFYERTP